MTEIDTEPNGGPNGGPIVFYALAAFLIFDRAIPDLYVLPVGISLKVYHLVAMIVIVLLVWATLIETRPLPRGVSGVLGLLFVAAVLSAPFVNGPNLSEYEANGAELGLVTVILFGGLFLAAHYVGQKGPHAMSLIRLVIIVTAAQTAVAGFEKVTGWLLVRDTTFLRLGVLIPDPGLVRGFVFGSSRIGGGFRPVATAPHPLVLSAVSALAVAIVIVIYPYASRVAQRWLLLSLAPLAVGLVALETRTGIVIAAVAGLGGLSLALFRKADTVIPLVFRGGLLAGAALVLFPSSARTLLNQFARLANDPSVAARTSDATYVLQLMADRPLLGPGFMTHSPAILIFDNSYFEGLIEFGVIGFSLFMMFLLYVTFRPVVMGRAASDEHAPILTAGLAAGLALLVGMATFDATKFAQFFPTVLILMGLALGRSDALTKREAVPAGSLRPAGDRSRN